VEGMAVAHKTTCQKLLFFVPEKVQGNRVFYLIYKKMVPSLDGIIEPIYFLITSLAFVILAFLHYKKVGKNLETFYLSILAIFFIICFLILNFF
tara:strand:+ start:582 stop:863 length:282 start_codon:yes stop_codon:yes gene_type:complete